MKSKNIQHTTCAMARQWCARNGVRQIKVIYARAVRRGIPKHIRPVHVHVRDARFVHVSQRL